MLFNNDGTNAQLDRNLLVQGTTFNLFTYVYNDPINRIDPSGQAEDVPGVPHNLKPPEGVPVVFVYRYTEGEWNTQRINRNEKRDFGKWTYIVLNKSDDPESVGSAAISNIGRGIHDIPGAPIVGLYSLFTWSNKFYGPRDRTDYVDVTFKLSYRHYVGPAKTTERDIADQEFSKHYADQQISTLSSELNKELKYFYIEQFGFAVAAEVVGGVFRLRTVLGEVESSLGGVGPGNVTVYRVEGTINTRIAIGERGAVAIIGEDNEMLFINFGSRSRAEDFFAKRLRQNLEGVQMKAFEVPKSFVDDLRLSAVEQIEGRKFPDRPQIVDPTKAPDQYGLRPQQIQSLRQQVIQGSGRVIK